MLGETIIDITTIRNFDDKDDQLLILNLVEDSELSLADPIVGVFSRELLATIRSWIRSELLDSLDNPLASLFPID